MVAQAAVITSVVALILNFAGPALAQQDTQLAAPAPQTSPSAEAQDAFAAQPRFRVQPMLKDLPPGVAATETRRTRAQQESDKKLEICRDC
jgi:hypothetical protein